MFSRDIFTADGILKEIESFTGVNRVELFVFTDTTSYDGWMVKRSREKTESEKENKTETTAGTSIRTSELVLIMGNDYDFFLLPNL